MELTSWQRQAARQYFTDHQLAPPYDHELDALASILQYHPEPQEKKHGYGCACADCGREREDRKASDRQDCETSEMTEEAKAANRAMIAEMEKPTGHPYKASTTSPLCEVCGERKINRYGTHGLPGLEQGDQQAPAEWSGSQCPVDPDGCWIDDETEEHVNAKTAERTAGHPVTA
jgi:hypothetical protein